MTAATNIQQDPFQSSSNVDPASGLGLTNEMKTVLETANLEISQLQRQVEDSADLLNKTQQKCRGLQQENHSLQQRMSLLEEEDQLHIQDKSRLAKQIQESEKQLAHQHDLVNTLKAQISKLSSTEKDQSELRVELEGSE
jgi:cell division protein FtsB